TPSPVSGSSSRQTISILGSNFNPYCIITLTWTGKSGYVVPTAQVTYVNSGRVDMSITTSTTADTWTAKITNPDNQFSNVQSFQVVAPVAPTLARLTTPANGGTLTSTSTTFAWDAGSSGISQYSLWIGSSLGAYDVYTSGSVPLTGLSKLVSNLPADGRKLYISLFSYVNGAWLHNSYTCTAYKAPAPAAPVKAKMTSPVDGATLVSSNTTFQWDAGSGIASYSLWIGNTPNAYDIHNAGLLTGLSQTVVLPTDGRKLYVSLWSYMNGQWQANAYIYYALGRPKVLLLLHGINTSPAVAPGWDPLIAALNLNSSPIIYNGKSGTTATLAADKSDKGVLCYRIMFGRKDASSSRRGLEDISPGSLIPPPTAFPGYYSGDFSQLSDLGEEVGDAVSFVLSKHSNAQVLLLAHSRGGLAARSFLQSYYSNAAARSAVVALHTIGTPHAGSPLGQFYDYLQSHPRFNADWTVNTAEAQNWKVVDKLMENMAFGIDVRRPTVGDFTPTSNALDGISYLSDLPKISYSAQAYSGNELGWLTRDVAVDVPASKFDISTPFDYSVFERWAGVFGQYKITSAAADYILGQGKSPSDFMGDGTVPASSQAFPTQGVPSGVYPSTYTYGGDVLHTEETSKTADVIWVLNQTVDWWK
ncbi:MAG: hypothetical protein ABL962_09590, partial [Fimbriimonadaceae bacterium]